MRRRSQHPFAPSTHPIVDWLIGGAAWAAILLLVAVGYTILSMGRP